MIQSFDIDGVIFINQDIPGLTPKENDVIITGRSFEEEEETLKMLRDKGINNKVFFNPLRFKDKTRESSGIHKANTIFRLNADGYDIGVHYEDDEIQIREIKIRNDVEVIHIHHNLSEKENIRHIND